MVISPQQLAGHIEVVSGLGTAAAILGIDVDALIFRYRTFGLATKGVVHVATGDHFDFMSMTAQRVANVDASMPRRRDYVEFLQRKGGDEIESVDHCLGKSAPGVDLDVLASRGVAAEAIEALRERIRCLSDDESTVGWSLSHEKPVTWSVQVRMPSREPDSLSRLLAAAVSTGVTAPQRRLLERVHNVLGRRRNVLVSFPCGLEAALPQMHLRYLQVPLEHVVRLLTGVFPDGEHATQLGQFAGAMRADDASLFTLELSDSEPLGFRVGVDVSVA